MHNNFGYPPFAWPQRPGPFPVQFLMNQQPRPPQNQHYFFAPIFPQRIPQYQNPHHPINIVSDSDDDDVVEISRPPSPPPIPRKFLKIGNAVFDIPVVSDEVVRVYHEAIRIAPEIRKQRLCVFLQEVVRARRPVDKLLDRMIIEGTRPDNIVLPNEDNEATEIMAQLFPSAYQNDLRKMAIMYGIDGAYRRLKAGPLPRQVKNPRPVRTVRVTSIRLAIELMDIVQDDEKEKEAKRKQQAFETAKAKNALLVCGCCFGEFLDEDMAQCSNGHVFCRKCLVDTINTFVGEGRSNLRCLSIEDGECDGTIPMSELERTVPEKTLKLLFATEAENAVINSDVQGLVRCHHCGIRVEVDGSGVMRCPECGSETCTGCGHAAHTGMSCEQFASLDKDRLVEDQMCEAVIRTCPKCQARFMKEEGCNKMECPRCHTWSCYLCRKEIPHDVGYDHFWRSPLPCPPDRCPLWVQNDTLHRIEAVQAQERTKADLHDA